MTIVTSVAVFFAMNPDEELSSTDVAAKWDLQPDSVRRSLEYAEMKGWVVRTRKPDPSSRLGWRWHYAAGPRLLKEIGR
jgi:predicted ArsR family transcriptional regulator